MFEPNHHLHISPCDKTINLKKVNTSPSSPITNREDYKLKLKNLVDELHDLQRMLYAQDNHSILLIFQGIDASGKDSTIRAVMSGINPAGCQVYSFKQPSYNELSHDFLWRTAKRLPERGRIGIFNRSYYEEVITVRVHPELLEKQRLPEPVTAHIWDERLESICDHEKHLARNGMVILKFWLHLSKEEQRKRLLARIENKKKNWKFSMSDVKSREHWDQYTKAVQTAINATAKPWAPWYIIPADDKPYMRLTVAEILVDTFKKLGLSYPTLTEEQIKQLQKIKEALEK